MIHVRACTINFRISCASWRSVFCLRTRFELISAASPIRIVSVIEKLRQLTKRDQVADFVDLKGLTAEKVLLVPNQKEFHLSSTAARLLSRRFMTFPAFSGFTPTCSRAARKCFRNRSKCTSFRPLSLDRAWAS